MRVLKLTAVLAKVAAIVHWVSAGILVAALICTQIAPESVQAFVDLDAADRSYIVLDAYGYNVEAPVTNGIVDLQAFFIFGIGCVLIFVLMAMIFRNLNLIVRNAQATTPFAQDNIRMLNEITMFSFAIPVIGLIMSIIYRAVIGNGSEISVNLYGFFIGIAMLCLTRFFIYGAQLEKDVDGLV